MAFSLRQNLSKLRMMNAIELIRAYQFWWPFTFFKITALSSETVSCISLVS